MFRFDDNVQLGVGPLAGQSLDKGKGHDHIAQPVRRLDDNFFQNKLPEYQSDPSSYPKQKEGGNLNSIETAILILEPDPRSARTGQFELAVNTLDAALPYFEKSADPTMIQIFWLYAKYDLKRLQGKPFRVGGIGFPRVSRSQKCGRYGRMAWHPYEAHALNGSIGLAGEYTDFADRERNRFGNPGFL